MKNIIMNIIYVSKLKCSQNNKNYINGISTVMPLKLFRKEWMSPKKLKLLMQFC